MRRLRNCLLGISKPPASTAPVSGLSAMTIYNCHSDNHSVHVWVLDQAADGTVSSRDRGTLAVQYEDPDNAPLRGACPAAGSEPVDLAFTDGHHYQVIITDPEAIGCPGNDPDVPACHRRWVDVTGNSHGGRQALVVE
jgi:hypothetical protein